MPQPKVKKAAFERRLDAQVDSVNRLHSGYPITHRRMRKTMSKFVVNALENFQGSVDQARELSSGEHRAREKAQAKFGRMPSRK